MLEIEIFLNTFISSLTTTDIIAWSVICISIFFIVDFITYFIKRHYDFKSIIVTIGLFGTFLGIYIGLQEFNSNNLESSVPALLDGLKVAFLTSVVGMSASILLSIIQKFLQHIKPNDEIALLQDINENTKGLYDIKEKIDDICQIIGNNKNDLSKLITEQLDSIDNSLKEALKTLSDGASKEIIKSLEQVIENFNLELQNQFGDNFKILNKSVIKMIEWQENYKQSVEQLEATLTNTFDSTEKVLTDILENHTQHTQELHTRHQQALTQNATQLKTVFSQFDEHNNAMQKSTKQSIKLLQETVNTTQEVNKNLITMTNFNKDISQILQTNEQQINQLKDGLQGFSEIANEADSIKKSLKEFADQTKGTLTNQSQQLNKLNEEVIQQLSTSLKSLNTNLTSLTDNFIKNYQDFLISAQKLIDKN